MQVVTSPCCPRQLPDVISNSLFLDAGSPTPAVHRVLSPVSSTMSSAFPKGKVGRLPAAIPLETTSCGGTFEVADISLCSGLQVCSPPRSSLPLRILPQGSRGFYVRAERGSLPPRASDMLTARRQAIGGTGTCTPLDCGLVGCSFPWADFRSTKAAVKMHTLLDLRGPIPSFIHISDGKMGDAAALDLIVPEAGAIYVMDRGYVDFRRLHTLHQAGAFFVTRTKINMNYHRVYSRAVDKRTGLRFDQSIALDGFYTRQEYPQHLRRVGFVDPETGKRLIFLTNHFTLPALTIAALYKRRWQVELFFKWIKQNLDPPFLRNIRERGEDANLDGSVRLRARCHRQKGIGSMLRSTLFYRFCPSIPSRKSPFCRRFRKAIPALPPSH